MHELYALRDTLCKELKAYGSKGEITASALDIVDKLAHTVKNLDKIIELDDSGYSSHYPDTSLRMYRDRSYARDRYTTDGYSRHGDLADRLHSLMKDAPNEQVKRDIQRLAEKVEQM